MKLTNRVLTIPRTLATSPESLIRTVTELTQGDALRWYVCAADQDSLQVEVTQCSEDVPSAATAAPTWVATSDAAVVISLIPTGIGCSIGGFAGDAGPVTALLARTADFVVTNPNAVNASDFILAGDEVVYTEGYSLDLFSTGATALYRPAANRIGVIIESADDASIATAHNVVNAVRAVHGIHIVGCIVTETPLGVTSERRGSGAYSGQIDRPDLLVAAGRQLIDAGATALAVTSNPRGLPAHEYAQHFLGDNPNPVGGAEAVVSHLLTRALGVPSAHAPMINFDSALTDPGTVDPRAAGEYVSRSGLASILVGLRRAPQLRAGQGCRTTEVLSVDDVVAVVAPATALGSVPVLSALQRQIPVIAVDENTTTLTITASALGTDEVITVANYLEAAGAVTAIRWGISLESVRRPLARVTTASSQDAHSADAHRRAVDQLQRRSSHRVTPTRRTGDLSV